MQQCDENRVRRGIKGNTKNAANLGALGHSVELKHLQRKGLEHCFCAILFSSNRNFGETALAFYFKMFFVFFFEKEPNTMFEVVYIRCFGSLKIESRR